MSEQQPRINQKQSTESIVRAIVASEKCGSCKRWGTFIAAEGIGWCEICGNCDKCCGEIQICYVCESCGKKLPCEEICDCGESGATAKSETAENCGSFPSLSTLLGTAEFRPGDEIPAGITKGELARIAALAAIIFRGDTDCCESCDFEISEAKTGLYQMIQEKTEQAVGIGK